MQQPSSSIAWDQLRTDFSMIGPCPSISIVIPSFNNAHRLPVTLESLFQQNYPHLEIVVIDASSKDSTAVVLKRFSKRNLKVYTVVGFDYYTLLNRGIQVATGKYIGFLRPGDFYLSTHTFLYIAKMILEHNTPDLVYSGSLHHDRGPEPRVMMNAFSTSYLRKGEMPTTLQSCWFLKKILLKSNRFDTQYRLLADFDILCRLIKYTHFRIAFTPRVLVDDERRRGHYRFPFRWMLESFSIIIRNFGLRCALLWLIRLKPNRLFRHLVRLVKKSLFSE